MELQYTIVIQLESKEHCERAFECYRSVTDPYSNCEIPHCYSKKLEKPEGKKKQRKLPDWRIRPYSLITVKNHIDHDNKNFPKESNNHKMNDTISKKDNVISEYLGHGIIRLFRETDLDGNNTIKKKYQGEDQSDVLTIPGDDTTVCILFVPTYFTVHDLLHFYIGDHIINNQVSNFRILQNHDAAVGFNFMVLMKFKDPINARKFKDEFNGKSFSKMDPEKCHIVFIKEVIFKSDLFDRDDEKLPYLLTDPFTKLRDNTSRDSNDLPVELPMCPVCLERMDSETTGLITIPCQHTFHCHCLDKWKNSKCPVCRYSSFRLSRDSLMRKAGDSPKCATCGSIKNLWICLICGNVGCGRYNSKHAIQHYDTSSHCFAMDIETQRVWDYAGDNYVHRIVQNEVDGKLVEVSTHVSDNAFIGSSSERTTAPNPVGTTGEQNETIKGGKDLDLAENFLRNKEYHLEYVQVLISQLESQREYYEAKLKDVEDNTRDNVVRLVDVRMDEMEKRSNALENKLNAELTVSHEKNKESDLIIKGLQENLDYSKKETDKIRKESEKLKAENQDLQEQVKDLMFFLETQEKFKDATEEEKNGTIIIQHPSVGNSNSTSNVGSEVSAQNKKRKKKAKKKKPAGSS